MLIVYHFENRTLIDEMVCNWCFLGTNYFFFAKSLEIAKKCITFASEFEYAEKIDNALRKTLKEGKFLTADLGGIASTTEFRDKIIKNL